MSGLKLVTGNRLEILSEHLVRMLARPLPSPLSPEIILVQSKGMERWLSMEIARQTGVCANCLFPFPNSFLYEILKKIIPDLPEEPFMTGFEPDVLAFKIMKVLPPCLNMPGFEDLSLYLKDDAKQLKLFQLSDKIANIFDQYLVFRPEMIFRWELGEEDHWQAKLWRELTAEPDVIHRAKLQRILLEKLKKKNIDKEKLPKRLSVFGISYLPLFHFDFCAQLSEIIDVNMFLLNPCREYWADIVSDKEIKLIRGGYAEKENDMHLDKGNSLLSSMGVEGRDFFSLISEFNCEVEECFAEPETSAGTCSMLSLIQSDILNLKDPDSNDSENAESGLCGCNGHEEPPSIQIHSCHSPMREIEVLYDNLLYMFEKNQGLLPKDIVVMAPDIETYTPFINAVFNGSIDTKDKIPFFISDRSLKNSSHIIEDFFSLLDLKNSRLGATRIMALMESPGIKEKFGFTIKDIKTAQRWIRQTNIRWGKDSSSRADIGLPDFNENTWKSGIESLLLGYAMGNAGAADMNRDGFGDKMFAKILPYNNFDSGDIKCFGKILGFLDRIFYWTDILNNKINLSSWSIKLKLLLEEFFPVNDETEPEIQVLKKSFDSLTEIQEISGFEKKIELDVIRSFFDNIFEKSKESSVFITGGVTFCSALPMRSVPFKIVCLLGMNDDAFPRKFKTAGFDIIAKHPKPGDRSGRNDDKYLFLETIISARQKLYISYTGQSIQDNTSIPPSILVSELVDYITKKFKNKRENDHIIIKHRLQPFSPGYFEGNRYLFSYSEEDFAACAGISERKKERLLISDEISKPSEEWKNIDIESLCLFYANPAKFIMQKRLRLFIDKESEHSDDCSDGCSDDRENFNLDGLNSYLTGKELVDHYFSGNNVKDFLPVQRAKGMLPHGNAGEYIFNEIRADADIFYKKADKFISGPHLDPVDVSLSIEGFRLSGTLDDVYENNQIHIRYAKKRSKDLLRAWIFHLALCQISEKVSGKKMPQTTWLICKDSAWKFDYVKESKVVLLNLLKLYEKGLSKPLPFFPESSHEFADTMIRKKKSEKDAENKAYNRWTDRFKGESDDQYYRLCFGKMDHIDDFVNAEFKDNTAMVYTPLFENFRQIYEL